MNEISNIDDTLHAFSELFPPQEPETKFDKILDLIQAFSSGTLVGTVGQVLTTTIKTCGVVAMEKQRVKAVKYVKDAYEVKCNAEVEMKKLNIAALDFEYWLSSRYVYVYQNASDSTRNYIKFDVRYVMRKSSSTDLEYYLSRRVIGGVNAKGILSGDSTSYSIRPIFKLKDGIKITGGSGTESDPYTLGV